MDFRFPHCIKNEFIYIQFHIPRDSTLLMSMSINFYQKGSGIEKGEGRMSEFCKGKEKR